MMVRTRFLAAGAVVLGTMCGGSAYAQTCPSTEARFGEIMGFIKTNDVMILGHRGYWGKYNPRNQSVPENSLDALRAANDQCLDGVEMDVKLSKDNTPYIMHDFNLGRTTNIYQYNRVGKYDPYGGAGDNATNPAMSDVPDFVIDTLYLLSPDRSKVTNQRILKVRDVANLYNGYGYTVPLVFDVKSSEAVRQTYRAVTASHPNSIYKMGMKVNATLYTTLSAYRKDSPNIWGIPVFTTNMLGQINVENAIRDWSDVSAMEINVKSSYGLMWAEKDGVLAKGKRVGVFNAIPDENQYQGTFFKNNGQCCYKLSDLYYTWKPGFRDTRDDRGDPAFLLGERFNLITTDDPNGIAQFFGNNGKRNSHRRSF